MGDSQEYFWGVELTKDKPTYTWSFEEEEDDDDYMIHTLFLKNAILGGSSVKGERNIVEVETKNFEKADVKQPLISLTLGQRDMCNLDVSFGHLLPVTFRLVEGSGPIALGGQQLVEFPPDEDMFDSQDESALEEIVDDKLSDAESPEKELPKKRKAAKVPEKKSKKGKMDESLSTADESLDNEEDDDDDDEEEMEEDSDDESSPEKGDKAKKKGKDQKAKKGPKTTKTSPKKAAKKAAAKKGKK